MKSSAQCQQGTLLTWDHLSYLLVLNCPHLLLLLGCLHTGVFTVVVHLNVCSLIYDVGSS